MARPDRSRMRGQPGSRLPGCGACRTGGLATRLVLAIAALCAGPAAMAPAQAETSDVTLVSNLSLMNPGTASLEAGTIQAQGFTTANAAKHLTGVTLSVNSVYELDSSDLTVSLQAKASGGNRPTGTKLVTFVNPTLEDGANLTWILPSGTQSYALAANRTYFVVVEVASGAGDDAELALNRVTDTSEESDPGWTISDDSVYRSGSSWTGNSFVYQIAVLGRDTTSTDATLRALALTDRDGNMFDLSPAFAASRSAYTATVGNRVEQVTVTATVTDSGATVAWLDGNDEALRDADGLADGFQADLDFGMNVVKARVTAEDGTTTETYTVGVTRAVHAVASVEVVSVPTFAVGYTPDEEIEFAVRFTGAVAVSGDPEFRFALGDSGQDREVRAAYERGGGTDTLVFAYDVQDTDNDADGIFIYESTEADPTIVLDADDAVALAADPGVDASLAHAGGETQSAHKVRSAPSMSMDFGALPAGDYTSGPGEEIVFAFTFTQNVAVTGMPTKPFLLGPSGDEALRQAPLVRTYPKRLEFAYTVTTEDVDPDGITLVEPQITLPEGAAITGVPAARGVPNLGINFGETLEETKVDGRLVPGRVTGLALLPSDGALGVTWDALPRALSYKVQWKSGTQAFEAGGEREAVVTGGATTRYRIEELGNGTAYTVRVTGSNPAGDGTASEEASATPVSGKPSVTLEADLERAAASIDTLYLTVVRSSDPGDDAVTLTLTPPRGNDWGLSASNLTQTVSFEDGALVKKHRISRNAFSASATVSGDLGFALAAHAAYDVSRARDTVAIVAQAGPAAVFTLDRDAYAFEEGAGPGAITVVARLAPGVPLAPDRNRTSLRTSVNSASGTAQSLLDYELVSKTVIFERADFAMEDGAWVGRRTVELALLDDSVYERTPGGADETLVLELPGTAFTGASADTGGRGPGGAECSDECEYPVTIVEDDIPAFTVAFTGTFMGEVGGVASVAEDTSGPVTVTVSFGTGTTGEPIAFAAARTVTLLADSASTAAETADWTLDGKELALEIPSGREVTGTSVTAQLTVVDDTVDEPVETLVLAARTQDAALEAGRGTLLILDDEGTDASGLPVIVGTPQAEHTLTARTDGISDPDGLEEVEFRFQWIRVDSPSRPGGTDIPGATSRAYTLTADDVGKRVKVRVEAFSDDAGNAEGPLESAAYPLAGTVTARLAGVCGRTAQVRDAIVALVPGIADCAQVTEDHLGAITELDLQDQQITALLAGDFAGLERLEYLLLNENRLTTLPDGVFQRLASLKSLTMELNRLAALPDGIFEDLTALVDLTLYENLLTGLGADAFRGLASLELLSLSDNRLTALPDGVFDGLTSLTALGLSDNRLTALPDAIFENLTALDQLWLNDNPGSAEFAPTADAGRDRAAEVHTEVTLGGSGSGGPWGTNVTYIWTQTRGPDVALAGNESAMPSFTMPATGEVLAFSLRVTGKGLGLNPVTYVSDVPYTDTDTVAVHGVSTAVQLSLAPDRVWEDQGARQVTVTGVYNGRPPDTATTVTLSVGAASDSATAGVDYDPVAAVTLTLPANAASATATFTLTPRDDEDEEGEETITVSGTTGAPGLTVTTATLALLDNESVRADEVRLVDGRRPNEGRVEIFHDGQWGTICSDRLNDPENEAAGAACRLMGYADGRYVRGYGRTGVTHNVSSEPNQGIGPGVVPIWLDDLFCSSRLGVSSLYDDCSNAGWGRHNCTHEEDAGLRCTGTLAPPATTHPAGVCGRTPQVRDAIVAAVPGVEDCADVTGEHLSAITELDLTSQDIDTLVTGDFTGLAGLTSLYLLGNRLRDLPDGLFSGLASLETLWLVTNELKSLPADAFDGLTQLMNLQVSDNDLTGLPEGIFDDLRSLTQLGLHENRLAALPAGVFDALASLTTLTLQDNELSDLPDDVFEPLAGLETLRLADNPGSASFVPRADAGGDRAAEVDAQVTLDGSASAGGGPWGANVTYAWEQTGGPDVALEGHETAMPGFTMPATDQTLVFSLRVTGRGFDLNPVTKEFDVPYTDTDTAAVRGISTAVLLSVAPSRVWEDRGAREVTVTGAYNARPPDTETAVTLAVGAGSDSATVGEDYDPVSTVILTLPASTASATAAFTLTPLDDEDEEGEETITVSGTTGAPGLAVRAATLALLDNEPEREGDLRLADGRRQDEGRVELFHDGQWGAICSDRLDNPDNEAAGAACRLMGYADGRFVRGYGRTDVAHNESREPDRGIGPGVVPIWLDDLFCSSRFGVSSLYDDCNHAGWAVHNCTHEEDAGLRCTGTLAPSVTGVPEVTAPAVGGAYAAGERIEARVTFDVPVTVDTSRGTPTLGLALGGVRREAAYGSGSGTATLVFAHTVAAADAGAGPAGALANGIRLNGATIRDEGGADAALAFGAAPTVAAVTIAAEPGGDGQWSPGEAVEVTLRFTEPVEVGTAGGVPAISLRLGAGAQRSAPYARGSGTDSPVFAYTLAAADGPVGSVFVPGDGLALDGGTIRSTGGLDAALGFDSVSRSGMNAEPESLTASFEGVPERHEGSAFTFRLVLSEAVTADAAAMRGEVFSVTGGSVTGAALAEGETANWTVTVTPAGGGAVTVALPATTDCAAAGALCTAGGSGSQRE